MSAATLTISIMPVSLRHHGHTAFNGNWISIMNMPNQGAPRQLFLYDHGRPHWSQGGPLFYDRRVPPPPPQMGNFPNPPIQGPSPQWLRGPFIGGPGPGPGPNQQQFDGFGLLPWGGNGGNNQGNYNYNRHNNRHHQGRNAGAPRNNRMLALNARNHNHRQQHNDHEVRYLCFKCGDYLQNSPESGIHLCDAGGPQDQRQPQQQQNNNGGGGSSREVQQQRVEDLQARLKAFLEEANVVMDADGKLSHEEIQKICLERAEKFLTMHSQLQAEQASIVAQQESLEVRKKELEKRDEELATLQTRLDEDRSKLARECKKEREEIARKWQELKDEILRMEEMNTMQKGRIRLDVGGSVFTTSRLTLTRDADSMLAAMFSGRHQVTQEEDGTVFIDRDGTHFRYILNYLRDGGVNQDGLPRDRQVLKELRNEAVYFQLSGLVQIIEKFL